MGLSLLVTILISSIQMQTYAQNKEKPKRDSYDAYFQCYKRLKTIPLSERNDNIETKRTDEFTKSPIALIAENNKSVFLFGDKKVYRYDLQNPQVNDRGVTVFKEFKMRFDEKYYYNCASIGVFPDGQINFNCDNQDEAEAEYNKTPQFEEIPKHDQKDEVSIELLRSTLKISADYLGKSGLEKIDKKRWIALIRMYQNDLPLCLQAFEQDTEMNEIFGKLVVQAKAMRVPPISTRPAASHESKVTP